ncbi:hypothetical protein ACG3PO_17125 [Pseudomonas aeruginosa]
MANTQTARCIKPLGGAIVEVFLVRELFRQIRRPPSAVFAKNYTAERCDFPSKVGGERA